MNVDRLLLYTDIHTHVVYVPVLASDFWVDVPVFMRYDIQEADKRKLETVAWTAH